MKKQNFFDSPEKLNLVQDALLKLSKQYGWTLEAWALFPNHYHFVGASPAGATTAVSLRKFLRHLHGETARQLNRMDGTIGRVVWFQYWETHLTFERSHLARLNYVHQNAVHHGLVRVANQYRWCSAAWFEQVATPAQVKTIYGFKTDRLRIQDDFDDGG